MSTIGKSNERVCQLYCSFNFSVDLKFCNKKVKEEKYVGWFEEGIRLVIVIRIKDPTVLFSPYKTTKPV